MVARITGSAQLLRIKALYVLIIMALCAACSAPTTPEPPPVALAGVLHYGEPVSGALDVRETRWVFVGTENELINIALTTNTADRPSMDLLDPNGASIARVQGIGLSRFRLPQDGRYMVVIGAGAGDYQLTVELARAADETPTALPSPTPLPSGMLINVGSSSQGSILTGDQVDLWSFQGTAGMTITLSMRADSPGIDPAMMLMTPARRPLIYDDSSGGGRDAMIAGVVLPETGTYYVQASGQGYIGQYTLSIVQGVPITPTPLPATITPTPAPDEPTPTPTLAQTAIAMVTTGAQIRPGDTVQGTLSAPDQVDRYIVFGTAGAVISVGMYPAQGSPLIPSFELYAPNGKVVKEAEGTGQSGGAVVLGYELPSTGAYILYAGTSDAAGAYLISVGFGDTLRTLVGSEIVPGATTNGELTRTGDEQVWQIDLPPNTTLAIDIVPDRIGLAPTINVIAPDGVSVLDTSTRAGWQLQANARSTVGGVYELRVSGGVGRYTLTTRVVDVIPTATPNYSVNEQLEIELRQGERYSYGFSAGDGVVVLIEAQSDSGFDPVIELYAPNGRRIAVADDLGADDINAAMQIALADGAGTYTVQVFGYALMPGRFSLKIVTTQ
jgi:hypothetical protein